MESSFLNKGSNPCPLQKFNVLTTGIFIYSNNLNYTMGGFPGGPVVKKLPAMLETHQFDPQSGKIPHAAEQPSPCTTTTEACTLKPVLCNKRSHLDEKLAYPN